MLYINFVITVSEIAPIIPHVRIFAGGAG